MDARVRHLQFNGRPENLPFYRGLFQFLGWGVRSEGEWGLEVEGPGECHLWFSGMARDVANDYDGPGLNHLGLQVGAQADVDATVAYLREHDVACLFDTPRHRPEFCPSDADTYYQVMFESPDRILLEVVYIGPRAAWAVPPDGAPSVLCVHHPHVRSGPRA